MVALPGATKDAGGTVGGSVQVGDVEVRTGDWVVGDADGVTVVARGALDAVAAAGRARAEKELGLFTELRAGRTTIDLLGLDPTLVTLLREE
jgi:4-hydroxy-4-methyl-2-oxoglutarate aldolase